MLPARHISPKPSIENIHVKVVESQEITPVIVNDNNSVYVPQSFGNSLRKTPDHPHRDRYVERHKIKSDIVLKETLRPKQIYNQQRGIISSRSRTLEKMTQTPDKRKNLKPETTRSIEISPNPMVSRTA